MLMIDVPAWLFLVMCFFSGAGFFFFANAAYRLVFRSD